MRRKNEPGPVDRESGNDRAARSTDTVREHVRRRLTPWVVLALASVHAVGCGNVVRSGRAPVLLLINRLEGASGAEPARLSSVLHSDVETLVERTAAGGQATVPTLFADGGQAELRLALKDAGPPGSAAAPTDNNAVTITRYRVSYRRTDGRNVPGVDLPYGFEGAATITIDGSGPAVV